MNPFLHDPVARHRPEPCRFRAQVAPPAASAAAVRIARRPARHLLARAMGQLAMAGGLGLAMAPAVALDVNTASAQQLESVRGLGPRMAEIIVRERTRGGRFDSLEDLSDRVRGIGPKRAQALQAAGLTVGPGPAATAAPASAVPAKRPVGR